MKTSTTNNNRRPPRLQKQSQEALPRTMQAIEQINDTFFDNDPIDLELELEEGTTKSA